MRLKKIIIAIAIGFVLFTVAIYAFLAFYDFNQFKPMIVRTVKDATGRELIINGNIGFEIGIRPTLVVEDAHFQNAAWSSTPDLARIKRLEIQIAVLPLILGKFDFAHLVLVEPNVIVEFDRTGESNFAFATTGEEADESEIPAPPLIFSDVLIEKGLFTFRDAQSNLEFSIRIDRLETNIPGFGKSLQLNFEGAFDDIPLTLEGTAGPIWAWVGPGYSLPADLTLGAGGATAKVEGELRDPIHFKNMLFTITAEGASISDVGKLFGMNAMPQLGAFKLSAKVADPEGIPALEELNGRVGSEELVEISITGVVKDLLALQGIHLDFTARGKDTANLTRLGIPPLPVREAFRVSGRISDIEPKVYTASDLKMVLGEDEIIGQVNLNLAEQVPFLWAELSSPKFELGPASLDLHLIDPFDKPAITNLDLKLGTPQLTAIQLKGTVADLLELQGVDIKFEARGQDLANLKQLTGQTLPVRGAFSAVGEVQIPVRNHLKIPNLKIAAGKNNITGSLDLVLRRDQPELTVVLSSPQLDLPSVLQPELAKQGWAAGLGQVRPVKLAVMLTGFFEDFAVKQLDLQAGTDDSVELRLKGSIENLPAIRGIKLNFNVQGQELVKLREVTGQPYFFAPVPGQGAYALSGNISDPTANDFKVSELNFFLADNELTGWAEFNLAVQPPRYEVELSAPKFNLKPFPIPKKAIFNKLNQIDSLGPLKIRSQVIIEGDHLSLSFLDLQAGSEQLAALQVKGSIKNLTAQSGIDLRFEIRGNEAANLAQMTDRSLPIQGAFALSGKLVDPAPKNLKISELVLELGANDITGWLNLNLSGQQLQLAAELASPKFTLQPVTLPALERLSRIKDLGPLNLALNLSDAGNKLALDNLDLTVGSEEIILLLLKGTISDLSAIQGMNLAFSIKGQDISRVTAAVGPEIASKGAFRVFGQFTDPTPNVYKLSAFDAVWGDSHSSGWLELATAGRRPKLTAELSSDKLDLRPFLGQLQHTGKVDVQGTQEDSPEGKKPQTMTPQEKSGTKNDRVFPADPLPLADLQRIDADLKFRGKEVLLRSMAFNDLGVDVLLRDGNLDIKPFKFKIGGGSGDGSIHLRTQKNPIEIQTALTIDQLAIGPMLDQLAYPRSIEGNLDAFVDLDGTGDSIAALMAGLNGDIRITMQDGKAESKYLDFLGKYLGSGILQMLNPFQKQRQHAPINCFVDTVVIDNGKADIKLLLDTDQTSIFAAGHIDLKTERIDMGIKPTPKKSALPANISFSLKEFSQPFRLGGTLAKPSLAIDPGRTAFVLGKMAGALALGPIGIAAFFADVSLGKKNACDVALARAMEKIQASGAEPSEETSQKSGADEENKKEKESEGFFRRLFGK